jgi:hypothetical protein
MFWRMKHIWISAWLAIVAVMLCCGTVAATQPTDTQAHHTNLLTAAAEAQVINIAVDCYPQALPNDGASEAEISVVVSADGEPVENQVVVAEVKSGDGLLIYRKVTTDADGIATFPYRAGYMPETAEVAVHIPEVDSTASVSIPLAPVTYMDVLLVTPEEYQAYLARQVSAAPIYQLSISVFPDQLAADGGSMSSLTAQLTHTDGTPAAGVPLTAQIISGEGSLELPDVATDADGLWDFYFVAGFEPGTATIQVLEPSTGLVEASDILLVKAGPARVRILYANPLSGSLENDGAIMPADGISGLPMAAEVTDLAGIPLSGVELAIELLDNGSGWVDVLDPVTDIQGQVSFTYYAGTITGPVRLRTFISSGLAYE